MILRREVPRQNTAVNDQQHDGAERDMEPVKPGQHEKGRAIRASRELEVEVGIGMAIFLCLQADEEKSQGKGQKQSELELAPLVELECPMRPGHGNARRQQYERIDCRKTPRPHGSEFLLDPRTRHRPSSREIRP